MNKIHFNLKLLHAIKLVYKILYIYKLLHQMRKTVWSIGQIFSYVNKWQPINLQVLKLSSQSNSVKNFEIFLFQ